MREQNHVPAENCGKVKYEKLRMVEALTSRSCAYTSAYNTIVM